jgi:hypothetical protein
MHQALVLGEKIVKTSCATCLGLIEESGIRGEARTTLCLK